MHDSTFSNTGTLCNPDFGISGVTTSGVKDTVVRGNTFTGIKNNARAAGVAVVDQKDANRAIVAMSSRSDVQRNTFSDNDLDVFVDTTGANNVYKKNKCTLSVPGSICSGI